MHMNQHLSAFTQVVTQSKLLNAEQKKELLDTPELLPETYRVPLIEVLRGYDDRARGREEAVRNRIEDALQRFAQELDTAGIADEEKQALLAKSRKQVDAMFRNVPAS